MFKPNYRISDYFLSCTEKIAAIQTEIKKSRIRLTSLLQLQKETLNQNVHSSTSIEGNQLSLDQVAALNENREIKADSMQKLEVTNYLQALRWILVNTEKKINKHNFLHLHKLIAKDLVNKNNCGNYRTTQNFVVDGKGIVIYRPPAASKVPKQMEALFAWINQENNINAVIISAIFHHQLVTIHPFTDGNGRIARSTSLWLLYRRQYDPLHIIALDKYFANDRKQYYNKIQQVRDLDYDFTYWLDYVAQGLLETMENVLRRIYQLSISPKEKITISSKQEELINFIKQNASCSSRDIGAVLKVNRSRVNQLISPLVKAGIIKVSGKAKATRYSINY